jgi:alkaline phosphatase
VKDSYKQEAAVPMQYETHGAEDVSIYASGPMSIRKNFIKKQ